MIKKQILTTKEEKESVLKFKKELTKDAEYIGENGDMCCFAISAESALKKFKRKWRDDVGEYDVPEMTVDDVGIGWLWLVDKYNQEEVDRFDESEWFVDCRNESDFEVFVYSN